MLIGAQDGGGGVGEQRRLLTVAQAADASKLSKRAIWNAVRKGAIEVVRVGPYKRLRIEVTSLKNFSHTAICAQQVPRG